MLWISEPLRLAWINPNFSEHRHKTLTECLQLLPRRAEAHVVVEAVWGKIAGVRKPTDTFVVLIGSQRRGGEADKGAHG